MLVGFMKTEFGSTSAWAKWHGGGELPGLPEDWSKGYECELSSPALPCTAALP